jgi:hypothetical protein
MDGRQRVRYSFLVRHPDLDRQQFSTHYREVHGPLAAGLDGFRRWTVRYDQNHVQRQVIGPPSDIDGITATWQRYRPDYSVGFFQEVDYGIVRADELRLFDVDRVRTVLGVRGEEFGAGRGEKLLLLGRREDAGAVTDAIGPMAHRRVSTTLDLSTTSALGAPGASFGSDLVHEAWFRDVSDLESAAKAAGAAAGAGLVGWHVLELTMVPA